MRARRPRIEALFASHPDAGKFGSPPGAGPKLAPQLLGEIGSDRTLYDDAESLASYRGPHPMKEESFDGRA